MSVADQSEARRSVFFCSRVWPTHLSFGLHRVVFEFRVHLRGKWAVSDLKKSQNSSDHNPVIIIPPPPSPKSRLLSSRRWAIVAISMGTLPPTAHPINSPSAVLQWLRQSDQECERLSERAAELIAITKQRPNDGQTHLRCEVVPGRQVFEAKEAVPLAGSASAGVVVHNLTQRHETRSVKRPPTSAFVPRLWCFLSPASVWFSVSLCSTPIQYAPIQRRVTFKTLFIVFIHFTSVCVEQHWSPRVWVC